MYRSVLIIVALSLAVGCSNKAANLNDHREHGSTSVDNNSMGHSTKDHSAMKSSPGAASAPIELQFVDTMIVHHQGAIDMAILVETRAEHAELKKLASDIIREQEREIGTMTELRKKWFGEKAQAINMEFPGMAAGMHGMDLKKLESLSGNAFDVEFVRQMIPHHEGAIAMARHIKANDSYAELKTLADDIIKAQEAEIRQMHEWLSIWEKR